MDLQVAESSGKSGVLRAGHVLGSKEQHLVFVQRVKDLGDHRLVEGWVEVHARDLRAQRRADLFGVKVPPPQCGKSLSLGREMSEGSCHEGISVHDRRVRGGFRQGRHDCSSRLRDI